MIRLRVRVGLLATVHFRRCPLIAHVVVHSVVDVSETIAAYIHQFGILDLSAVVVLLSRAITASRVLRRFSSSAPCGHHVSVGLTTPVRRCWQVVGFGVVLDILLVDNHAITLGQEHSAMMQLLIVCVD